MNLHGRLRLVDPKGERIFHDDVEGGRIAVNICWMCGLHASLWLACVRLQLLHGFYHVKWSGGVIRILTLYSHYVTWCSLLSSSYNLDTTVETLPK